MRNGLRLSVYGKHLRKDLKVSSLDEKSEPVVSKFFALELRPKAKSVPRNPIPNRTLKIKKEAIK